MTITRIERRFIDETLRQLMISAADTRTSEVWGHVRISLSSEWMAEDRRDGLDPYTGKPVHTQEAS